MYEHAILTANCNFSANMLLYNIMVKIVLVSVSEKQSFYWRELF